MAFEVLVSRTFQRFFDGLDETAQRRVRQGLEALATDPYRPRPGADIKPLTNTEPTKHRLRVGPWRVIYHIDEATQTVKVLDGFSRGQGYR